MRFETGSLGPSREQVWSQLSRILASKPFRQSARLQRLLTYLVEATLADEAHRIKGYTLALDVFDRDPDFDSTSSALVRVEMGRLRSKLTEYYSGEGAADRILIELPRGVYQLVFLEVSKTSSKSGVAGLTQTVERSGTVPPSLQPSIAVLPFADLSEKADQAWFAEGIAEDLIVDLSKLSGLRVCSRHASRELQGVKVGLASIASTLGVRYVLQGSIRREQDQIRVNASLSDAWMAKVIWTERYERTVTNALTVQSDIAACIVDALRISLSPFERARLGYLETSSAQAHEAYLKGLQLIWIYTESSNLAARKHFLHAIQLDPEYASAYAWVTRSLVFDYTMQWQGAGNEVLQEALQYIERALQIDGLLAVAYAMQSWVNLWLKRYDAAIEAGRTAVALDPNNDDAHSFLSVALTFGDEPHEALRHSDTALKLNPLPTSFQWWVNGMAHMKQGNLPVAAERFEKGVRTAVGFVPNHMQRIFCLAAQGRQEDAKDAAQAYISYAGTPVVRMRAPTKPGPHLPMWLQLIRSSGIEIELAED